MPYVLPSEINCKSKILDAGTRADLPVNFDPDQYPILSEHWFGWQPLGGIAAKIVRGLELCRDAEPAEPA